MGAFIVFIVAMGIKMATSSQSLYEVDYYEKGEDHTSRMKLQKESEKVILNFNHGSNKLSFQFDTIGLVSKVKMINLSNSKLDKNLLIDSGLEEKAKSINLEKLEPGIWVLEVDGRVNNKPFFIKKQVVK